MYYQPNLCLKLTKKLLSFANTSVDISDGLITDLEKLINKQKLSYKLDLNNIPISNNLKRLLNLKKFNKISFISKGDDYQVLFTANPSKFRIISKIAKSLGVKISKIGKIAGCEVIEGKIDKKSNIRLLRDNKLIYDGKLNSLKKFKEETAEVKEGSECGMVLENFQDIKQNDILESYIIEEQKRSL